MIIQGTYFCFLCYDTIICFLFSSKNSVRPVEGVYNQLNRSQQLATNNPPIPFPVMGLPMLPLSTFLQMQDCFNGVIYSIWVIITWRESFFTKRWQPPSVSQFPKAWRKQEKNRCSSNLIHNSLWTKNSLIFHCKYRDLFCGGCL